MVDKKGLTKEAFKKRWESDDNGGGLTYDDAADCAVAWGITSQPKTKPMNDILYRVLIAAGVDDAEDFRSW